MIRKFVTALVLLVLAVLLISFAIANRQVVNVSLDPFSDITPALVFTQPLYLVVFALVICGVVVGGCATWLGQGKWRARARRAEVEVARLRAQVIERGSTVPSAAPPAPALRLMVPPPAA
jgi:uncharacterized integral membrane protein